MTPDLRAALQTLLVARFSESADGAITLTPSGERELKTILELFRDRRTPIAPGVRISRARMDGLGTIDTKSGTVEVGAGMKLERLEHDLRQRDLSLGPLSPGMLALDVATFLEGPYAGVRVLPGGRSESMCLALTALMADGLRFVSRPAPRSATGPELDALFLGGEGRFGFVTGATLRCFGRPRADRTAIYSFTTASIAVSALRAAVAAGCNFRRAAIAQRGDRAVLQSEIIGTTEGVERDLSSLGHVVFARGGRSSGQDVIASGAASASAGGGVAPERELGWDELAPVIASGKTAVMYRLSLDSVVVSGWDAGGAPLGARGDAEAWANRDVLRAVAQQADPLNVLGGVA